MVSLKPNIGEGPLSALLFAFPDMGQPASAAFHVFFTGQRPLFSKGE